MSVRGVQPHHVARAYIGSHSLMFVNELALTTMCRTGAGPTRLIRFVNGVCSLSMQLLRCWSSLSFCVHRDVLLQSPCTCAEASTATAAPKSAARAAAVPSVALQGCHMKVSPHSLLCRRRACTASRLLASARIKATPTCQDLYCCLMTQAAPACDLNIGHKVSAVPHLTACSQVAAVHPACRNTHGHLRDIAEQDTEHQRWRHHAGAGHVRGARLKDVSDPRAPPLWPSARHRPGGRQRHGRQALQPAGAPDQAHV